MQKFIPMFIIGSLVIFNFVLLRNLKDSLMISSMGTKSIQIAKMVWVLPASVVFMFVYTRLSNHYDGRAIFTILVAFFAVVFGTFGLFFMDTPSSILSYVFYTMAEMWGTVAFGTGMWAFFNDICTVEQAKRFYVLVSGAQIGSLVASGIAGWLVRTFGHNHSKVGVFIVVLCCILILVTLYCFGSVFTNIRKDVSSNGKERAKDYRGFFSGIKLLFKSRYLFLIMFITLSYNFTIIVTEFIWKSNIEVVYKTKEQIFLFMSNTSLATTIISSLVALFLTGGFMKHVGFTMAIALFPLTFGVSTSAYFFIWMTPVGGAVQWLTTKTSKYSFADPAKQMLYMPCSEDERYKAKSVIDMVGARGGKALASLFNWFILAGVGSFQDMANFSYPILMVITILWILAAVSVGIAFNKSEQKLKEESNNE